MSDLISRRQAIDAIMGEYPDAHYPDWYASKIRALPSAQSEERTEKRTETHACDLISRQAAIDALMERFKRVPTTAIIAKDAIENLPPAQPEEAIPVSWIEAKIERFMMAGDAFSGLTASIIRVMLNEWKKEQEGDTK